METEEKKELVIIYPGIPTVEKMTSVELMELKQRVDQYAQFLEKKIRSINQR